MGRLIESKTAWYPAFPLGCAPHAVPCELRITEWSARSNRSTEYELTRFIQTPFAMLDYSPALWATIIDGRGYYATEAECDAYLAAEYPHWQEAAPIMDALARAHHESTICGPGRVADRIGVYRDDVFPIARGHRRFKQSAIKRWAKELARE